MNDPATRQSPDLHSPAKHETTDANPLVVVWFAGGLAMMVVLAMLLLVWIFGRFETEAERADPVQSPLAGNQVPPEPRLQTDPSAALARLRKDEDERLSSYGWIDQQQGIVRVPIERAIDLLAERGLPQPKGTDAPAKQERIP